MSENIFISKDLSGGEFYGKVIRKRSLPFSILSEVIHQREIRLPEHSHKLAYFTLVVKGDYREKFSNKTYLHSPMSILWHRAGISHTDQIGNDGGCFFTIEIRPEYLTNLVQYADVPEDFIERNSSLIWQAKRLYREFKNWEKGSDLLAEGIILEMLAYAVKKQGCSEKAQPAWLSRVAEKLRAEFTDNFTAEELALEAGVHPVHLASVFRQFYQESIGQYVQKLRIDHASKLLQSKKVSLSEIAYASGFTDQSHFTRIFKRYFGMTPGKFRNSQL